MELTREDYEKLLLEHNDFKHEIEGLERRMDEYEKQQEAITSLTRSVDRLTLTMSNLVDEHKDLKADVKAMKEAPAEQFNYYKKTFVSCVITTIVGTIIGALVTLILT